MKKLLICCLVPLIFLSWWPESSSGIMDETFYSAQMPESDVVDGPYVMYGKNQIYVKYVKLQGGSNEAVVDSIATGGKNSLVVKVATDEPGKTFEVAIKEKISPERADYKKPEKQMVISDIEGNFSAFRKLLQAGGVINDQFDWTFGKGHLVLIGDFVDRGNQVTEVLWLVYALEEKAKKAGGYVHFVLGNHEIMNMSGDLRYLHPKYAEAARLLNVNFVELLGESSELGRWLRSKNIVEKIGSTLYVHAGISRSINQMEINLSEINRISRPYYADSTYAYSDARLDIIYSDAGPFWYRGYYAGDRTAIPAILDSTLEKFDAKRVVTGHTMVADTVSVWYSSKLINTDTHHAKGKSEGLFVDGSAHYRIGPGGQKTLLTSN